MENANAIDNTWFIILQFFFNRKIRQQQQQQQQLIFPYNSGSLKKVFFVPQKSDTNIKFFHYFQAAVKSLLTKLKRCFTS